MLSNHRRAVAYSIGLLAALVALVAVVGRHPGASGTVTSVPAVGGFDFSVYSAVDDVRNTMLSGVARALDVIGSGVVTIPLRIAGALVLLLRRYWRKLSAWLLTWLTAEVLVSLVKAWADRGRPPHVLFATGGASFPSGHATAAAATAVALVLVIFPAGPKRRKWEAVAILFTFLMASSRIYLNAHWFSDVVAGVLLGTGVALGCAGLVTGTGNIALRRHVDGRRRHSGGDDRGVTSLGQTSGGRITSGLAFAPSSR